MNSNKRNALALLTLVCVVSVAGAEDALSATARRSAWLQGAWLSASEVIGWYQPDKAKCARDWYAQHRDMAEQTFNERVTHTYASPQQVILLMMRGVCGDITPPDSLRVR